MGLEIGEAIRQQITYPEDSQHKTFKIHTSVFDGIYRYILLVNRLEDEKPRLGTSLLHEFNPCGSSHLSGVTGQVQGLKSCRVRGEVKPQGGLIPLVWFDKIYREILITPVCLDHKTTGIPLGYPETGEPLLPSFFYISRPQFVRDPWYPLKCLNTRVLF
ncbi:hypothetical protein BMS3Bbin06_00903 [bacterium BMS3Bbin06]|nr:hypothetical protein BMS3Bbin06_00903 [bacterium BMS3Bbin06]